MLKALGWFLFLAFDAAIVVWFVMPHGAPPTAPTIPPPNPTELAVAGNSVGGINAFSFNYAYDMARTDGTRNAVFSPLTTYAQLILLERAANYRSGRQDSNAVRESSRLLEQLASDPALTFTGELTVSRDIGIDEWLAAEFKRNGIAYSVDLAKLAAMPDRFPGLDAAPPDAIFGVWKSRLGFKCPWPMSYLAEGQKAPFRLPSGRVVKRFIMSIYCGASSNFANDGDLLVAEVPFWDGFSLLVVMPPKWNPAQSVAELSAVTSGKRDLERQENVEFCIPAFTYQCDDDVQPLLRRMGYFGNYAQQLPSMGTATSGLPFDVKIAAKAQVFCDCKGMRLEAETYADIAASPGHDPEYDIVLDHPFLYAIRHNATGVILGIGWVVDPAIEKPK